MFFGSRQNHSLGKDVAVSPRAFSRGTGSLETVTGLSASPFPNLLPVRQGLPAALADCSAAQ